MSRLSDDPMENLRIFVADVTRDGCVWALRDEDGWAILDSHERPGYELMPFWSTEDFAFDAATDEWMEYEVAQIQLSTFLDTILPTMQQEQCMVAPNWPANAAGLEIDAGDLGDALAKAMGEG